MRLNCWLILILASIGSTRQSFAQTSEAEQSASRYPVLQKSFFGANLGESPASVIRKCLAHGYVDAVGAESENLRRFENLQKGNRIVVHGSLAESTKPSGGAPYVDGMEVLSGDNQVYQIAASLFLMSWEDVRQSLKDKYGNSDKPPKEDWDDVGSDPIWWIVSPSQSFYDRGLPFYYKKIKIEGESVTVFQTSNGVDPTTTGTVCVYVYDRLKADLVKKEKEKKRRESQKDINEYQQQRDDGMRKVREGF